MSTGLLQFKEVFMGKYDLCMKEYLQNKEHFADLFNGCCFQGKQVIKAEELQEASESYVENGDAGNTDTKSQSFRDIKMQLGSRMVLQVLAVENQSYVDYGMPVRCMDYDVAEYKRQMREKKQHFQNLLKQLEKKDRLARLAVTYAERLSGIHKTDRLHPVYTICIYSGTESWDGPKKLSDMMTFGLRDEWKELFADYPVRLYCVNEQSDFSYFHTELKELLRAMNCRKDKLKLKELMKDEAYAHLSEDTWQAVAIMTDSARMVAKMKNYKRDEEQGGYDMCQAMEELMQDYWNDGRAEGKAEGTRTVVLNMLKRGFRAEEICSLVECDASFVEELRKSIKNI